MKSRATPRFWSAYGGLPAAVQAQARRAYLLFKENPAHPSLQFKKVSDRDPIYSARVTRDYRTLGLLQDDGVTWFSIGSHAEYDRLIRSL